jgi:hypothetical protein
VPLGAAGAAGVDGAASSEQSAPNSVRKQVELKSTRLTVFDYVKISKDEVSSANITV